jgi:hypothetical protein
MSPLTSKIKSIITSKARAEGINFGVIYRKEMHTAF